MVVERENRFRGSFSALEWEEGKTGRSHTLPVRMELRRKAVSRTRDRTDLKDASNRAVPGEENRRERGRKKVSFYGEREGHSSLRSDSL